MKHTSPGLAVCPDSLPDTSNNPPRAIQSQPLQRSYPDLLRSPDCGLTVTLAQRVLSLLQQHRREQYEKLTDSVYKAKGYDQNSIPLDQTLQRLGMYQAAYIDIVVNARNRKAM